MPTIKIGEAVMRLKDGRYIVAVSDHEDPTASFLTPKNVRMLSEETWKAFAEDTVLRYTAIDRKVTGDKGVHAIEHEHLTELIDKRTAYLEYLGRVEGEKVNSEFRMQCRERLDWLIHWVAWIQREGKKPAIEVS